MHGSGPNHPFPNSTPLYPCPKPPSIATFFYLIAIGPRVLQLYVAKYRTCNLALNCPEKRFWQSAHSIDYGIAIKPT